MRKTSGWFLLVLGLIPLFFAFGCGSQSHNLNPIPIVASVSPTTIAAGSGALNLTVTGTYFQPNAMVNINGVSRATTYVNSTQLIGALLPSDTATAGISSISVTNPSPGGGTSNTVPFAVTAPVVSVVITPANPTLGLLGTQQFSATVSNTSNTAVTWTLTGTGCTGSSCGTLDGTGRYIAPACMVSPAVVTVTATSVADTSKSASATVALQMAGPQLGGQYAFYFHGAANGAPGVTDGTPIVAAGTITAAAGYSGAITTGILDQVTPSGASTNVPVTGSYSMTCYGGGQLTLTAANNTVVYAFSLTPSGKRGHLMQFDHSSTAGVGTLAAGVLAKQDPAAFNTSVLAGNYAFGSSGNQINDAQHVAVVGQLQADASGNIASGTMDMNLAGTILPDAALTGTWSVSGATGRGTGTLHVGAPISRDISLVFYPVSTDEAFGVYVDPPTTNIPLLAGQILRQTGSFSAASFNANSVISFAGMASGTNSAGNGDAAAGILTPDGAGNITAGYWDENNNTVITSLTTLSGVYSLDGSGSGRGSMTLNLGGVTRDFTLYFVSPNSAYLMDGTATAAGPNAVLGFIEPQVGAPFSDATLSGAYSLCIVRPTNGLTPTSCGGVASDGNGNTVVVIANADYRGTYTQYQAGTLPSAIPANGRLAFAVPSQNGLDPVVVYFASPLKAVFLDIKGTQHQPYLLELTQ